MPTPNLIPDDAAIVDCEAASVHQLPLPVPDRAVIARFARAMFKHADPDSYVSLRDLPHERGARSIHNEAVLVGDLAYFIDRAVYGAGITAEAGGVFAPPVATFNNPARAAEADLAEGLTISVDIDSGDTGAKRDKLTAILGEPTMVVASGGEWIDADTGVVHDKLHVHWRLAVPTRTPEAHTRLADARRWAVQLVDSDRTGAPVPHPFRWPGTLHLKGEPRFARIVAESESEIHLDTALEALHAAGVADGLVMMSRTATPHATVGTVEEDIPANIARFEEVCRHAEKAVPGGWHAGDLALSCRAVGLAVSCEAAKAAMREFWVPRGEGFHDDGRDQRWEGDVEATYAWARTEVAYGSETPQAGFAGVRPPEPDTTMRTTAPAAPVSSSGLPDMVAGPPLVLDPAAPMDSALALIDRHHTIAGKRVLRFQGGTFYRWTGHHYAEATREELGAQVWQFLHDSFRPGKDGGVAPFKPTTAKVADVVAATGAACQMPSHVRAPCWLDAAPHPAATGIVACANGLLDLATDKLLPATPAFFTLNSLPFAYDPSAPGPAAWLGFLRTLWPDDADSRDTLQEIFGLLLTAETRFQKAFLLVGPKRSGKGTIARVLTALLGQDNVCGPTLGQLGQQFGSAPLIGKRLAIIADARLGGRADAEAVAERILNITGEDSQTIDRKFRDAWTGKLDARLLIISNELPRLADASGALASRLITLILTQSFYGREDHGLTDRMTEELPGILNWAIAGWRRLAARKRFNPPIASREAQQELEDLGSPISVFIRDRCVVGLDAKARPEALYMAWRLWCAEQGRTQPGTLAAFGRDLRAALPAIERRQETVEGVRAWLYSGVGLLPSSGSVRPPSQSR